MQTFNPYPARPDRLNHPRPVHSSVLTKATRPVRSIIHVVVPPVVSSAVLRALVTGGAGFVGSHLVDALLNQGYEVTILDALSQPVHPSAVPPPYVPEVTRFIMGDACDRRALSEALKGADLVFHLAAYQDYRPDYSRYFRVNAESVALLFELLHESPHRVSRVVLVSSQAIYGDGHRLCPTHGLVAAGFRPLPQLRAGDWTVRCTMCGSPTEARRWTEEEVPGPSSAYGVSKFAGELAARRLAALVEQDIVILRPSIIVGPRQSPVNLYSGACRIFATALLAGKPCRVHEDGMQLRDFVPVQDVVSALMLLARVASPPPVLNVGGPEAITVNDLLRMVAEVVGSVPVLERTGTFRLGDSRDAISDTTLLQSLGWRATTPLRQAVAEYVAWLNTKGTMSLRV